MKKAVILIFSFIACAAVYAGAFDIRGALGKLGSGNGSDVTSIIGNVLSSDNVEIADLTGTWNYSAPAVTFKSDNLLQRAGGAAAASTIIGKLEPIYIKAGIDKMTLTVAADSTFEMKVRGMTLKGMVSKVAEGDESMANFVFNFQAGKFKVGKVNTYVVKDPVNGTIKVMFDVTKLIQLVKTVGSLTGNATINTVSKALESYDGLCAGFELKK